MLPAPNSADGLLMGETLDMCGPVLNTGAAEVMRQHFTDALDFVADFHSLTKIKVKKKKKTCVILKTSLLMRSLLLDELQMQFNQFK